MPRTLVTLALAAALVAPLTGARADHCPKPIYLFSYVSTPAEDPLDPQRKLGTPTIVSSAVGCLVIATDDPTIPGDESDTDYIYPGSDTLVVRWLGGGIPARGTLAYDGAVHALAFYNTTNGLAAVVDSQQVTIDPASTLEPNLAEVTVCAGEGEESCESRTYRTLATT